MKTPTAFRRLTDFAARQPLHFSLIQAFVIGELAAAGAAAVAALIMMAAGVLTPGAPLSPGAIFTLACVALVTFSAALAFYGTVAVGRFTDLLAGLARAVRTQVPRPGQPITLSTATHTPVGELVDGFNTVLRDYQNALEMMTRQADRLSLLSHVAAEANRSREPNRLAESVLPSVVKGINWDVGLLYLVDEHTGALTLVCLEGLGHAAEIRWHALDPELTAAGHAARTLQIIVVEDAREDTRYTHQGVPQIPVTQIAVPLVAEPGHLQGVLLVGAQTRRTPAEDDLNLIATVAYQLALGIQKMRLHDAANRSADELRELVEERTLDLENAVSDLQVALNRAEEADRLKSLLLSTVSHELRTPLATIKGNASLLEKHRSDLPPDVVMEHLKDIDAEADKLTELINNLMDMSRIEAGLLRIQPEHFGPAGLLEAAIRSARRRHPGEPIALEMPDALPPITADPRRVEQVLDNLIDNAFKYSGKGKPVTVRTSASDGELTVAVTDEGPGIAPEYQSEIFQRFFQISDRADAARRGVGLGLAISRGIIEAHGGRIWVESEPGSGSTFLFTLPLTSLTIAANAED